MSQLPGWSEAENSQSHYTHYMLQTHTCVCCLMRMLYVTALPADWGVFTPAKKSLQPSSMLCKQLQHTLVTTWPCACTIKTSPNWLGMNRKPEGKIQGFLELLVDWASWNNSTWAISWEIFATFIALCPLWKAVRNLLQRLACYSCFFLFSALAFQKSEMSNNIMYNSCYGKCHYLLFDEVSWALLARSELYLAALLSADKDVLQRTVLQVFFTQMSTIS